jgi:non-canonical (house-cleaning) NTP pyrophosphatase
MIIRCPTRSEIKLKAVTSAIKEVLGKNDCQVQSFPVELQDRVDLDVNAEPVGRVQTLKYARERIKQMRLQQGPMIGIDISIESGIIDGFDVACVIVNTIYGETSLVWSQGVKVPDGALEEATARGLKTTTVGDIIHEWYPEIPADDWQGSYSPFITRQQQIQDALIKSLQKIDIR